TGVTEVLTPLFQRFSVILNLLVYQFCAPAAPAASRRGGPESGLFTAERRLGAMVRRAGMSRRIRVSSPWRFAVFGAVLVVGAAPCSSSGSTSSSSPPPATTTPSSAPPPTGAASSSPATSTGSGATGGVTDFVQYTGGKAGAADSSLSPVTIGW